jgi:TonB family protein
MTEAWKQWEGQAVNGELRLGQYLGGSENSAVFLTEHGERGARKTAIKLLALPPEESELQLCQWELAAKLSHPHLMQLFQMGHCQLGEMALLYVVMEHAEENLAQIVPSRALTPAETRDMLEPILDALAYVHGQGFVHGHIKPANIMAVDDQLKISSDGLYKMGESRPGLVKPSVYDAPEMAGGTISPAADVWSLGMMLVEALTQHLPVWERSQRTDLDLPETLPADFLELARHCLRQDLQHRWTVANISAHMHRTPSALQGGTVSSPRPPVMKWRYVALLVALGVVIAAMLVVPRLFHRGLDIEQAPPAVKQPAVQSEPPRNPVTSKGGKSETRPPKLAVGLVPGKVLHQVLPDVPRKARDTIRGTVKVSVRVHVDPSGNVAGAKLDSAGPSRYFAQLALKAARRWKFRPAEVDGGSVPSEWILRFQFEKAGTTVLSVHKAP